MPDPKCSVCGNNYDTKNLCAACANDPANDGWKEGINEVAASRMRKPIEVQLDADANDLGSRRRSTGIDDDERASCGSAAPIPDLGLDNATQDPSERTGLRTESNHAKRTVAQIAKLEDEREMNVPTAVKAGFAGVSERRVRDIEQEFGRDAKTMRRVAAEKRAISRRRPRTVAEGELDYEELITAAWHEWRCSGAAVARDDVAVSRFGHHVAQNLDIEPPRWFVTEELGFEFEHGPSLLWTCSTLETANERAIKKAFAAKEYPADPMHPPDPKRPKPPVPRPPTYPRPTPRVVTPPLPCEATFNEIIAPYLRRTEVADSSTKSADSEPVFANRGKGVVTSAAS